MAKKSAREIFVADFETTTTAEDCRVWGWGLVEARVDAELADVVVDTTIERFFDAISRRNSVVYFHNLAFDGSFILDYILKAGFTYVEEYAKRGEFQCLISAKAKFYSITVVWHNGVRTEFRDSVKKIPMSVARMAQAFKLPMSKLTIDYAEYRSPTHVITPHEREYIAADVVIVARAIAQQLSEGMTKLTVGSDSLAEFKTLFGKKLFDRTFPVLGPGMDADIRKAYRGGWTYSDTRWQGKMIGVPGGPPLGKVYDVNSLYPSVMMNSVLPYGMPVWFDGMPDPDSRYPLFIVSITFTAKLKKDHVPCLQVKGSSMFGSTEYLTVVEHPVTLSVTNVDLDLWQRHYDMDILAYDGGWYFHGLRGFFDEFINKWSAIKAAATGGLREIAKLFLNSLYGKFATNPNITGKIPVLDGDVLDLELGPPDTRDPVYTAMGVFITAYAREVTVDAAQANYATFAYADTDSIHLVTTDDPLGIVVDPHALGAWKCEYEFEQAIFWRAKAYAEHTPGGVMHTHVAGLPDNVARTVTFDDFREGKVFQGKLLPKRVPGGIILVNASYTLK